MSSSSTIFPPTTSFNNHLMPQYFDTIFLRSNFHEPRKLDSKIPNTTTPDQQLASSSTMNTNNLSSVLLKPTHSYIGLIAMAILSSDHKQKTLSEIYQWILDNYTYFHWRGTGWRNSIRHNLSLNDCFLKAGRANNGKGHYWTIHPANIHDFTRGDYRRKQAQWKVKLYPSHYIMGQALLATLTCSALKVVPRKYTIYNESRLAHQLLDNLTGIEIGASSHNPFGLNALNVDYSEDNSVFKTGTYKKVDIIASGDKLPFATGSQDFVISSHVIEHFYDPVKTIKEWLRVVKPGGYVYIVVPHKDRTFDRDRNRTTVVELVQRHEHPDVGAVYKYKYDNHYSVWTTQDFVDLCKHYNWKVVAVQDVDDKLGIGFTVVIKKE